MPPRGLETDFQLGRRVSFWCWTPPKSFSFSRAQAGLREGLRKVQPNRRIGLGH
jgi:hypothetical protein